MKIATKHPARLKFRIQKLMIRIYLRYFSFAFYLVARFILLFSHPRKPRPRSLLVLKPDAIGDYVLMRNFLYYLRKSERFKGYHVTWCGNSVQKSIFDHFDQSQFDDFIWIDKNRIYRDVVYYASLAIALHHRHEVVIHPVYSREFIFDFYAKIAATKERITFRGDAVNINPAFRKISDSWYTELIDTDIDQIFEFYRYKTFFHKLLHSEIDLSRPYFNRNDLMEIDKPPLPDAYVVVFAGAQMKYRQWSPRNFAIICDFIRSSLSFDVVLIGSKGDIRVAREIINHSHHSLIDLTGKTSMVQVIAIMANAKFVLTNDTAAAHLAPALDTPCIALSQLNHYGRFLPYPAGIATKHLCIIPDEFIAFLPEDLEETFRTGSLVDINLITTDQVIDTLKTLQIR
ncbi:MAG TPA: glycosyltransferase family 9 protein [Bacteroidales bacterium]|nr:glycosyltransferase family 9 protein [Bacteroidales bacterium]